MSSTTLPSLQEAWVRTVVWGYAAGISGMPHFRDSDDNIQQEEGICTEEIGTEMYYQT